MKALVEQDGDRILGFTAFGAEAGEVMAAVQVAMAAGLPYTAARDMVLTHPTIAEGLGDLFASPNNPAGTVRLKVNIAREVSDRLARVSGPAPFVPIARTGESSMTRRQDLAGVAGLALPTTATRVPLAADASLMGKARLEAAPHRPAQLVPPRRLCHLGGTIRWHLPLARVAPPAKSQHTTISPYGMKRRS